MYIPKQGRHFVRNIFIGMIISVFMLSFYSSAAAQYRNGIPVLLYHHVSNDQSDMPELTVTPAEFERQVRMLKEAGFATVSSEQFIAYMRGEKVGLPDKPILITFDDGYDDNYIDAFPVLRKHGFKAIIFMVGINFDRDRRLSGRQIQEMAVYGFGVGGHSMTHPDLTKLGGLELKHQVLAPKSKIREVVGQEAEFFAFPCGFYNLSTWEEVERAGYDGAFTTLTGLNKAGVDNIYLLRRIPVYNTTDFDKLIIMLNANYPKTSLLQY